MINFYKNFIGLETQYKLADGTVKQRIHLDGAASPLMMTTARDAKDALLPHYSNSHSHAHSSAHICGNALNWAQQTILSACDANDSYALITLGNGCTAVLNNIARRLTARAAEKPIVFVSAMEHHANDLPHRQNYCEPGLEQIVYIPLEGEDQNLGAIDLNALRELFEQYKGKVNYISFSGVSNVTGIINPIQAISALAHEYEALVILDAAQLAPHSRLNIAKYDIDFAAFSGHKIYTAGAPGIMIAKQALLEQYPSDEVGGGIVSHVSYQEVKYLNTYPEREQAGTKNVLDTYALAKVMESMRDEGFQKIQQHSEDLWQYAYECLSKISNITIYGKSTQPRLGALAFNIEGLDHGFIAAVLSDYFAIAVRNGCFCAHPYVSSLLKRQLWGLDLSLIADEEQEDYINRKRGMVRASFSLYNTKADIDALKNALLAIISKYEQLKQKYAVQPDGSYHHKSHTLDWRDFI